MFAFLSVSLSVANLSFYLRASLVCLSVSVSLLSVGRQSFSAVGQSRSTRSVHAASRHAQRGEDAENERDMDGESESESESGRLRTRYRKAKHTRATESADER